MNTYNYKNGSNKNIINSLQYLFYSFVKQFLRVIYFSKMFNN